jgi:adenine-specific DNA-methyltransferase
LNEDGDEMRWGLKPETVVKLHKEGYVRFGELRPDRHQQVAIYHLQERSIKDIASGEIVISGRDPNGAVIAEYAKARALRPMSVWNRASHSAGDHGATLLNRFLPGRHFPFPKSLYAVEDTLRFFVADKPGALILDFFAGSATTAHAVMRLNRQDGGRRRSIMVTNNEVSADEAAELRSKGLLPGDSAWEAVGICQHITEPRIRAAVTGETPEGKPIVGDYTFVDEFPMAEGFEENAEFFDLTYEDPERIRYGLDFSAIAPLLWLRAASEGTRVNSADEAFAVVDTYAVLFDLDATAGFVAAVRAKSQIRIAYIVTDDETQFQAVAGQLPHGVESVRLYAAYLDNFGGQVGA